MFTIRRKVNWLCAMLPRSWEAASAIPNLVHTNENNEAHVGDVVEIMQTRPLSKDKCWRVIEILERAK